jgi:hypothetical protein
VPRAMTLPERYLQPVNARSASPDCDEIVRIQVPRGSRGASGPRGGRVPTRLRTRFRRSQISLIAGRTRDHSGNDICDRASALRSAESASLDPDDTALEVGVVITKATCGSWTAPEPIPERSPQIAYSGIYGMGTRDPRRGLRADARYQGLVGVVALRQRVPRSILSPTRSERGRIATPT